MSETSPVDIGPFLRGRERRTLCVFVAALCISLVLSAIIVTPGALDGPDPAAVAADRWLVAASPLVILLLWVGPVLFARKPSALPDGSLPMNADDARNVRRVANAGGVFVAGMYAVLVAGQALWLLGAGGETPPVMDPVWGARAALLATGALSICFGNIWPRMPTPRAAGHSPAVRMKYNRFMGWTIVILGGLLAIAAFLPPPAMIAVTMAAALTTIVAIAASAVWFRIALKSGSAT